MEIPIPGLPVDEKYQRSLQSRVAGLVGARHCNFPGAQPVSFRLCHMDELLSENYFVSEKADGIRYLLYSSISEYGNPECFLIDRNNQYYRLDSRGFVLPSAGDGRSFQNDTILDGELVLDVNEDDTTTLWFLLFDCIVIEGKSLMQRPFTTRLGYLKENVLKPYKALVARDRQLQEHVPFQMDLKRQEFSYGLRLIFDQISTLRHKNDGLIFTSSEAPYVVGTCEKMLKWKPANQNTVDFKLMAKQNGAYSIALWYGGVNGHRIFGPFEVSNELRDSWSTKDVDGAIVECKYDPDWPGRWKFDRFRRDKDKANHISTYHKIMQSIRDRVDADELIQLTHEIRRCWKQRESSKGAATRRRSD
ncbi:mRNA capping enzyme, catalytic domain-containing protein [Polychytrium aggregatum]|uniref:mRNA capping enzyme, catalytic domain-containing protein n=1 Tax=Polychytrium aggregatum TaxID=110093 RepID=UPI0022FDD0AD|nr:mRNA capping enzyme, catalytic domain-containing protein [Polychytrium aggregatum]KAI9206367.1 mRNA capping enzyme, catalytic domain-containing protein [Polychytrium aggregatum]